MDNLAEQMDRILARLERAGMKNCPPKLNEKKDPKAWLSANAAPWAKLANEKPKGETIAYDKLLQAWKEGTRALKQRDHGKSRSTRVDRRLQSKDVLSSIACLDVSEAELELRAVRLRVDQTRRSGASQPPSASSPSSG